MILVFTEGKKRRKNRELKNLRNRKKFPSEELKIRIKSQTQTELLRFRNRTPFQHHITLARLIIRAKGPQVLRLQLFFSLFGFSVADSKKETRKKRFPPILLPVERRAVVDSVANKKPGGGPGASIQVS
jgi:hypothetical protein